MTQFQGNYRLLLAIFALLLLPLAVTGLAFNTLTTTDTAVFEQTLTVQNEAAVVDDIDQLVADGLAAFAAADYLLAEAKFTDALRQMPEDAALHNDLGLTLVKQGRLQEALALYETAVALNPELAATHYNLGDAQHRLGQLEEAKQAYLAAIKQDPALALAYNGLGNLYQDEANYDSAIAAYRRAIRLNPTFLEPYLSLAAALTRNDLWTEAAEVLETAVATQPDQVQSHYNLALVYLHLGNNEAARQAFQTILSLDKTSTFAEEARLQLERLSP